MKKSRLFQRPVVIIALFGMLFSYASGMICEQPEFYYSASCGERIIAIDKRIPNLQSIIKEEERAKFFARNILIGCYAHNIEEVIYTCDKPAEGMFFSKSERTALSAYILNDMKTLVIVVKTSIVDTLQDMAPMMWHYMSREIFKNWPKPKVNFEERLADF